MGMPDGIGAIDLMIGFPAADMAKQYAFITQQTKDRQSKEEFQFPAEYMFKNSPDKVLEKDDPVGTTLREMDKWGVEKGMIGVSDPEGNGVKALKQHPDRFIPSGNGRSEQGHGGDPSRSSRSTRRTASRRSALFPAGTFPQVAINDKKMYPIYAKCVELGIPSSAAPACPGRACGWSRRRSSYIDEVMYDFPELDLRHPPRLRAVAGPGGQADAEVAEPLLLHERLRPEALPAGDHQLRQHPRRRQDHVRRLLPDGPVARADHDRDARRRRSTTACGRSSCAATPSGCSG